MRAEIERFFGSYCGAFNRADVPAIAWHIAVPGVLLEKETTIWSTADQVVEAMDRLVAYYRDNGFKAASFVIDRLLEQGANDVVADIVWTIERAEGLAAWRFRTGYNLRRHDGAWRIVICTAYEEVQVRQSTG